MSTTGWVLLALFGAFGLYVAWMLWRINRDTRPGPRWPGDP